MTRKPLFWILLVLGVSVGGCCLLSVAILGLGALSDDSSPSATTGATANRSDPGAGGEWKVAVEIARGGSLTQSLPGDRWVAQYGSNVELVVGRSGVTQWVQTNTSGSIYDLAFDDDGTYVWNWAAAVTMYGQRYASHGVEKGSWSLSGTQLALQPESQSAVYTNNSGTQEKADQDLNARRYQLLSLTMETLDDPKERFPGVLMSGPKAAWDTSSSDQLTLTLQRVAN